MGLNHVYKVIWNKTKGCYVVVSELAKRVGRNKAKAIVMATAAMAMVVTPAVMNVNQVEATVLIGSTNGTTISDNGSTVNTWGITIGGGITNAGEHSVHVGDATLEEGNRNVIIGTHATAGVDKIAGRHFVNQSVAIGGGNEPNLGARAFGDQSIAIGSNTISEGNSSIAIGNDDVDKAVGKQISYTNSNGKEVTDTLGSAYTDLTGKNLHTDGGQYADTRSGEAAVAIGVKAEAGDISLALGTGAKAKKVNTVSIGTGATADLDNSVAIGGGAVADETSQGTKQTSITINGITYGWAGGDKTNKGDIVSFGKSGFERQLKNIAAGEISSTSTDAINGSQIHSLVEKITGTPKLSYTTKDGTPVYKLGDKFYKVNEQGQPISAVGKPAVGTNEDGKLVDADKNVIEPIDPAVTPLKNALVNPNPAAGKTGTTSPTALNNITSNLVNFDAPNVNGKVPAKNALRNLVNDAVSDDTVATVGDLRNMGWIVSADKTTGADGTATDTAYSETVKNANEVKFVGKDGAIVSGATDAATGVRTITVGLDKKAMSGSGDSGSPVAYTKADGTKVYPVKAENGSVTYHTTPNGDGPNDAEVPKTEVITSVNGPEGTTTPAALTNVAGNLVGAKKDTNAPTTEQAAPTVGKGANEVNPNNAATVGDVLNAGWNLQENGTAKDFVKPYDKVNFVNGGNTTAVVTTNADGTVSNVSFNVTGLPVSYTTEDGKPVSKVGDKFYKVNENGQPISEAGKPAVKTNDAGKLVDEDGTEIEPINPATTPLKNALVNPNPAADKTGTTSPTQLTNVEGNLVGAKTGTDTPTTEQAAPTLGTAADQVNVHNVATVGDVLNAGWNVQENGTAKDFVKPYDKVNFVNGGNTTAVVTTNAEGTVSNVSFNVTGLPVSYTTEDGKPVSKVGDKFYKVNEQGQPVSDAGKPAVKTNDAGKLVDEDGTEIEPINPATTPLKNALVNPNPAADKTGTTSPTALNNVTSGLNKYGDQVDGKPVEGTTPANTGLIDLSTPADGAAPKVSDNTAATVGDLRNMGWIVSADKTTGDLDTAYSATVKNANEVKFVGTGTAIVSGETKDGVRTITVNVDDQVSTNNATTPVVYTKADGTKVYPIKGENGAITYHTTPDGKGDNDQEVPGTEVITSVNSPDGTTTPATLANVAGNLDGAKKDTTAPKAEAAAPNTINKDGDKYINPNNAATVGDVLNAGWNLQENGTAKDFVKPYDTVNFVNGGNTTAVVTTNAEGTVSNVSFNVTGLPVTYTTEDGKPVSKVGDKFYKVNEQGQPVSEAGKPAVKTNDAGKLVDEDGTEIEPINPATTPLKTALVNPNPAADKTETTTPTALNNVTSGLNKYGDQVDGKPVEGTTPANTGLIDLSTPADGAAPKVSDNTAATVGDLRNMGWIVSADKTTGDLDTAYSATVKNANEVKFVGTGTAIVSGETKDGVRTITVNVDDQVSTNNATTPVVYTKADGTKVYPIKGENGAITYHTTPDGKGKDDQEVPGNQVVTSVNGPEGTTSPTTLKNVKNSLPTVNDVDKTAHNVDGTAIDGKNNTAAPITAKDAADLLAPMKDGAANPKFVGNNAATVSDVLNAGWNLQENGTAKDFVKPYDTVNFINGANTTAVVTTSEDGSTSKVTYNVTGLPVTYTTEDGKPVSKVGDKFYKVNEQGQPVSEAGKPAVKTNDAGKLVDEDGTEIEPINPATTPLKTALVNPNPAADKTETTTPTALNNVTSGLNKYGDQVDGKPVEGTTPANTGLIDLSTPADGAAPKVSDNTAATVGDLRNMGWIVSADKTTGDLDTAYSATVKNANEVKFVGTGTAIVSGETKDGVRTITVNVDDQVSTNNAVTPVVYTDKEGNTVYPIKDDKGNVTYHTTPDGKGENDKVVPNGDVNTSVNGPKDEKGNTRPASLGNVKNNIPAVNDADKKVTNPDGTEAPNVGDVANINKAPLTAEKAADLLNPTTKDGKANPNFAGNNAATVSDVLNAGWNLQNNGTAKDFVKPFDTVNFVNGGNTTAVVTTKADGTTSDVTFNVTGLPIATTITDPTTGKQVPVVKVGDTFYPANPDGTPNIARNDKGEPTNGYVRANDGKLYPREAVTVTPSADPTKPPTVTPNADAKPTTVNTNLANPNVDNTTNEPGNNVNTPTQLGNVANGANTFAPVAADGTAATDAKPAVKLANDGKWYPADQVEANGKPKADATPVANPLATKNAAGDVLERGNDGNWYKASDLENGEPKPNVDEQTPVVKPENAEKTGLVNFENSNPNNAATVGDLQNLGFVVAAHDNGYTEQMRNANKVEFKGSNGVSVTGKTLKDGTREITVALKEGRVTNDVIVTNADGTETHGVRGEDGKIYQKDPKTGKATKTEIQVAPTDTVTNDGNAYVTGNSVATAIQKSGWNIGIGSTTKEFSTEEKTYEKVNPSDKVKYVNGDNTTVSMAVDEAKDKDGTKVTTTYVKVDVNRDLKIDSVTAGGPAKDGVPGKDGAMTVKDADGKDGVSATAKDGKGTLTLNNAKAGKDGNNAASVAISTDKAPADLDNTPKDAVRANDGKWYAPADVDVKTENGTTVVTPKDGKSPIADAPTMDRIQYKGTDGKLRDVATMDDGLRFQGDDGESISKPLNSTVQLTGGNREDTGKPVAKDATTTGNIGVFNTDGKLSVQLAKDLDKLNSANFESKTDKAGNPLKVVDGQYYPEKAVVKEGKVYPEGTVIIDNKPYPAGTTKDAAGKVVNNGKPATEATPINPIDSKQVQDGPTSKLTGTGLTFNTPTPKDEKGNPLVLVDGKYYKADNLENGKPKADAKPEPVKPAQATAFTPDGLVVTPDTAKVVDPKTGEVKVDPNKVVSFGAPSIVTDPATGKPVIDPKTGEPVMKSGISAGGQVMANVAPGVLDTDAVNVSQLKGVSNMVMNVNNRVNRLGAQAAAMAGLRHLQYDPLEPTTIMAGVGTYKGEGALALGIAHYKNESTLFHAGASIGSRGDELMANAGVSWKFGSRADETAVKDTFRQGPISASYTLQDKVSALEEQNQVLKEQVAELFRRLNEKA